jgi:uncharacterized protein (TIGR02996 family)
MDNDEAFLRAITVNPANATGRLVYADWLEERGDSRSNFVRALVAHLAEPKQPNHHARLKKLRKGLDPLWLAAIGDTSARLKAVAQVLDKREGAHTFEYAKALACVNQDWRNLDSCITVRHVGKLLDLEVCAHATDHTWMANLEDDLQDSPENIRDVCEFIASPEIAPAVRSLYLWTTVAANGLAEIILDGYVSGGGPFTNLKQFSTNFGNEDGECIINEPEVIAKLLAKCPMIEELTLPSAPTQEFFSVGVRPIKKLHVKAGLATNNFIQNLSRSDCFPQLETFIYQEDDTSRYHGITPVDHFIELLQSRALQKVSRVEISCTSLGEADLRRLQAIGKEGASFRRHWFYDSPMT